MTPDLVDRTLQQTETVAKAGVKIQSVFWTLGQYNAVILMEAPDEKAAMRTAITGGDFADSEILVAVPVEEARKFVE